MIKIYSGKLLLALISMLLISGIVFACAFGDWDEEYGVSNFTPEVFVNKAYSPFFFSNNFYYHIEHDREQNTRFNSQNAIDWFIYFNKTVPINEFHYFLETITTAETDSAYQYISGKTPFLPDNLKSLQFFKGRKDKKSSAFLSYLLLAKKAELFSVREIQDDWDYDSTKNKAIPFDAGSLNKELKKGFVKSRDSFLKERYWFQLGKSYFFNGTSRELITFFDQTQGEMPRNPIYFRVLSYVAGAYYKLKDFSKANYYYSKVYDGCDELKTTAHYSFHPQEEKDWEATLALCSLKEEKETLWQMLGVFYSDEKRAINEIYKLNPQSEKLDLLLARAVNKYEQKFTIGTEEGKEKESEMPTDSLQNENNHLHKLITSIALGANTNKPWIWYLAAGYLNTLDQRYDSANFFYAKAKNILPGTEIASDQLRLLKLITRIGEAGRIDTKLENELVGEINWIRGFENNPNAEIRGVDAYRWLKGVFSSEYKIQHEPVKAECFLNNTAFYADSLNRDLMKAFLSKKQKTAYEELCTEICPIKLNDIYEYEAVKLTLEDNIDGAIEKMKMAGPRGEGILPANPFNNRLQDCHDCDQQAVQKIKYSKLTFLNKLKELKSNIDAGNDVYNNALLMANASYNITQYGNNRIYYESEILGEGHSDPYFIEPEYRQLLLSMDVASRYYKLALSVARTGEEKAKSCFMIAKCERNEWYNKHIYNKKDEDFREDPALDLNAMTAFKELKKYSNTAYYSEVIKECGYFRNYLKLY